MTIDQARFRKSVARWHRRLAIVVAAWLIALAASGVLINHANDLGLDRVALSPSLQQWVYGTGQTREDYCSEPVSENVDCAGLFAKLQLSTGALLLGPDSLVLLDRAGQLVEILTASHLGLGRLQAGLYDGSRVYLRDAERTVQIDTELMEAEPLDTGAAEALNNQDWQIRGEASDAVSWERLLLDLHAARFLGAFARWFNDLMAGLILVLALSGIWLYRLKKNANGNGSPRPGRRS